MSNSYANHYMKVTYDDGMANVELTCIHRLEIDEPLCGYVEGVDAIGSEWFLDPDIDHFNGDEFASGYVRLWWEISTDWETGHVDGSLIFEYADKDPDLLVLKESDIGEEDITGCSLVVMSAAKISAWKSYRMVTDDYTEDDEAGIRVAQGGSGRKVHRVSKRKDGAKTIRFSIGGKALPSSYVIAPGSTVILHR